MTRRTEICLLLLFSCPASRLRSQTAEAYQATIPKVWDDAVLKDLEVPLTRAEYSPKHVPASFYYQVPVRPIYKSYPVYHPDREPKGYIEWLRSREPEIDWDAAKLKTKEDWIRAGETVFDAPLWLRLHHAHQGASREHRRPLRPQAGLPLGRAAAAYRRTEHCPSFVTWSVRKVPSMSAYCPAPCATPG